MTCVPGVERLRFSFEGTARDYGIVDRSARYSQCRSSLDDIEIFVFIESNRRQALANFLNEKHRLVGARAILARNPCQDSVELRQAMSSRAARRLSLFEKELRAAFMVLMFADKGGDKNGAIKKRLHLPRNERSRDRRVSFRTRSASSAVIWRPVRRTQIPFSLRTRD